MSNLNGEVEVHKKMETTIGNVTVIKKIKRRKMKNNSPDLGGTCESTQEVKCNEAVSSKTITPDANMVSKEHDCTTDGKTETTDLNVNGKEEREKKPNKRPTLAEILNPQYSESLEAPGSGTTSTDNQESKIQKRQNIIKNSDLGDFVSTRESTHKGLSTTKVVEVKIGESVSAKTATADENMVSKEQDHTEVANGKNKKKKEPNPKNKWPILGEILNPSYLQNLDASKSEKASGSTSTENPVSKKLKRKLNKNSYSSDILSISHESTQEVLSTAKVLEVVVSKGDHIEVANGKTGESETTNNGNDASKLTKSQKKNRRRAPKKKLKANLGSVEKREDTENPNSKPEAQFYSNTDIGTSATIDNMTSMSCPAATGEMGSSMSTNLNGEVEVQKKMETSSGTTATDNTALKKRKREKKKNNNSDLDDFSSTRENTQEGVSTTKALEVKNGETVSVKIATPDANMVLKEQDHTEVANGKKKRKRKLESKNKLPTLGENLNPMYLQNLEAADIPASGDICENISKVVEAKEHDCTTDGKTETTDLNVNSKEEREKKPNKRPTLAIILNPQYSESLEVIKGEPGSGTTSTDNQESNIQKRQNINKKSDLGDFVSTRESTHKGLSTTKVVEVKIGESVSAKTATADENMVSKEQDHTEVANGKMEESETTDLNVNGKNKKKKEPNPKNKQPTLGEILNPSYLQNLDASKSEKASGSTSTDESTQEVLSTAKVLEVVVSKGDHIEVANGKTGESETTNNGNDATKLTKSQKKNRRAHKKKLKANLGSVEKREDAENPNSKPEAKFYSNTDIGTSATVDNMTSMSCPAATGEMGSSMSTNLNGELEVQKKMETSSGTTATDNTALKKRKREKKKNNNSELDDFSSTRENTQEGVSTTKALEVKHDETVSVKIATPNANMVLKEQDHTEVANGKKKRKRKLESKNMEAADIPALGDICENTSKVVEAVSGGMSQGGKRMEYAIGDMSLRARNNLDVTDVRKEETKLKGLVKKLLILDVNGLLVDVSSDRPKDVIADKHMHGRAIFKRPYLDDFLHFCFERFNVAIWSSRTMRKLDPLVYFLFRDLRWKLLFVWDGCECTDSDIDTLEVKHKRVVVKDLRKIWDADCPNNKWVKGTFNESNTLLVDDSPYKGLLNPKYTGIFPASYSYKNSDDNFLGPKGELQTYLEGLAAADDVRTYVEQHPFGQGVIDEQNPHWEFYSSILERLNNEPMMKRLSKKNRWKRKKCCHGYQKRKRRSGKALRR